MVSFVRVLAVALAVSFVAPAHAQEEETAPEPAPAPVAPAKSETKTEAKTDAKKDEVVPRPKLALCIGLGAGAVVALVVGAALGGVAKARSDEQNGDVHNPPVYTDELASRAKQGAGIAAGGYTFLAIGGVLALADIALWVERFRHPAKGKPPKSARGSVVPQADGISVSF